MNPPVRSATPNIGIDWLTVTFRHDRVNHDILIRCLMLLAARYVRRCTFPTGGLRNGFEQRFMVNIAGEAACYAFGGNMGYAMLEFRGSWCAHVDWQFWRLARWFCRRYNARATRIDIAADFYQGEIDLEWLEETYREDPAKVLHLAGKAPAIGVIDRGSGRTLYFGTRQSPREICVYEKGRQLAGKLQATDFPGWVRVELRHRKHPTSDVPLDLMEPSKWWRYIWGLGPAFAGHVPDELSIRRQYSRRALQAELNARMRKQLNHVRDNYGKFLWLVSLLGDPAEVLSMVTNPVGEWSALKAYPDWRNDRSMVELLCEAMAEHRWDGFASEVEAARRRLATD